MLIRSLPHNKMLQCINEPQMNVQGLGSICVAPLLHGNSLGLAHHASKISDINNNYNDRPITYS